MPVSYRAQDHLQRAKDNKHFSDTLAPTTASGIGWALVAYFYSAVHAVNAFGAKYNCIYGDHKARNRDVQINPQLDPISNDYDHLQDLAWQARYNPTKRYTATELSEAKRSATSVIEHIETLL